jgi:hypothetical protein
LFYPQYVSSDLTLMLLPVLLLLVHQVAAGG